MNIEFSKAQQDLFASNLAQIDADIAKAEGTPNHLLYLYNKALMLLAAGKFEEGWPLFKVRFNAPGFKFSSEHFPLPTWNGEQLAGKHVFLWLEQGIGDQIMSASMLNELTDAVGDGSVTLLADRVLVDTLRRSFPKVDVYKVGEEPSERLELWDFDFQLCFSDLGLMFRKSFTDFPGTPYLKADPAKTAAFRHKYSRDGNKIVGIAWSSANNKIGRDKSFRLAELKTILTDPNYTFVNMQYGDHFEELMDAKDHGVDIICDQDVDQLIDMDDFCAQVASVDYIISNSNTLVHVAGALGVEAHVLLPLGAGRLWYWFSEATRNPWYASLRLHRQTTMGEWAGALFSLKKAIYAPREDQLCQRSA